jgi:lysozyme
LDFSPRAAKFTQSAQTLSRAFRRILHLRKAHRRLWLAAAVAVVIVAGVILGPRIYARLELAPLRYGVIGVDVSHHQGRIDWRALTADGIAFAYIKATEGESFRDANFAVNWADAANAGVPRGAYHFFTLCRTGADQARNFIATVPRDPQALPPVVDAESIGPCSSGTAIANVPQELEAFLAQLAAHYGRRPLIYTTPEFHDAYLQGQFPNDQFWIRSLVVPPSLRYRQWILWQYHDRGQRRGVQGPVDLNAFRGSKQDFAAFAKPSP